MSIGGNQNDDANIYMTMFRKCSVNQQQEYLYCDGASYGSRPPQREVPPTNPLLLVVDLTCWTAAVTVSPLGSHYPSVTAADLARGDRYHKIPCPPQTQLTASIPLYRTHGVRLCSTSSSYRTVCSPSPYSLHGRCW